MQGAQAEVAKKQKKKITWKVKYLYDGDCAMCNSLKSLLERQDNGRNIICFVNIADDDYNPKRHMGITYEDAMDTIHVIRNSGEVRFCFLFLRLRTCACVVLCWCVS